VSAEEDDAAGGSGDSAPEQESAPQPVMADPAAAERMAARTLNRARSSGGSPGPANKGRRRSSSRRSSSKGDPVEVGAALEQFLDEQGWDGPAAIAHLAESWPDIVGPEVAEHVQVESVTDGTLHLRADSTAWATQVRLLASTVLEQVGRSLGPDLVTRVEVKGPQAPSWKAGPRVVKGRGPRDTYG